MPRLARLAALPALVALAAGRLLAQDRAVEAHLSLTRTTVTHANGLGVGARYERTWHADDDERFAHLATSVGADYDKAGNDGPSQAGATVDVTGKLGAATLVPYAGASVGVNWLSGDGVARGPHLGLQLVLGAQYHGEDAPYTFRFEIRPGYVRTQEHAVIYRFGLSTTLGGS
jgi:hypothetical protein